MSKDKKPGLFPYEEYWPFRKNERFKELDGVYRSLETGHIHLVKNVWLRGYIDPETNVPYFAYTCSIKSTSPDIGNHKRIGLHDVPWEFLFKL